MTICVRRLDGWCATRRRKVPVRRYWEQATRCGDFAMLPWANMHDYAEREPTCTECRERLGLEGK